MGLKAYTVICEPFPLAVLKGIVFRSVSDCSEATVNFKTEWLVRGNFTLPVLPCYQLSPATNYRHQKIKYSYFSIDRVSVPSPIAIDVLMDTMARDRAHMYLFSV